MFYIDIQRETERRYSAEKFMPFKRRTEQAGKQGGVYDVLDSYMFAAIKKLPMAGTYLIVEDEGNPPLISYRLYGHTEYWWMLMTYNSLVSPMQLKAGVSIKYPILSELEALYAKLAARERHPNVKKVAASTPQTTGKIGDPDSLNHIIPSGNGNTNAMLLRAYASFAAQKYDLAYAIIDDFQTTEGINIDSSSGIDHTPYKVDMSAGGRRAPVLTTVTHHLLDAANGNAVHIAMLPDTEGLNIEYSLDGGTTWEAFNKGVIFTKGGDHITLRFIYNPSAGASMKRAFNGYVIVHN
ncbi:hypothetical protein [Pseudoalteromonas peptidolytica]|uniref:hypothetical protein n=1 Tax=Pseudoalteromonas peptidolytica TaxID=61150 RepID=UPI00298DE112|nr:hypothetical protein [Pseudoalteromonas peptidolytica]MDW7551269.1 hypothetical protein [Pseudoalteromonas peptidolytica]